MSSVLLEAEKIVNGERATDYGSAKESFGKIARLTELLLDDEEKKFLESGTLTDTIICKVLIALKYVREANKHKRDNLVDACGYSELLNRLKND